MTTEMTIELNGKQQGVPKGTSIEDLIFRVTGSVRGSAVIIGGEVVPRSSWETYQLTDGQAVELITAVQGG